MGSVKIDTHSKERSLESKYAALDNADGVRLLLSDYHALCERRYKGDYAASDILIDLHTAIERAGLTDRQRQALWLVYGGQLTQEEAGKQLGIRREAIRRHVSVATTKIARVFESWARRGEGYVLTVENKEEGRWDER